MGSFRFPFVTLGLDPRARGAAARSSETARERATEHLALGSSPRVTAVVGVLVAASLAACGQQAEKSEPTPVEQVSAEAAKSDAQPAAPVVLTAAQMRQVCQAGLAAMHGQELAAIQIDGLEGQVVNASWRAPVDGGRRRAQCRVDGDIVTWKPMDSGNAEQNRWMNQATDPVTRFAIDGDRVAITTTLPDGTATTEQYEAAD
jgi:hypothetical protein